MMENEPLISDATFAKVITLPDGSEGILVGFQTFKVEGVSANWLVNALRHRSAQSTHQTGWVVENNIAEKVKTK